METESWIYSVLQGPEDHPHSDAAVAKWSSVFAENNLPYLETKLNELISDENVGENNHWCFY